MKRRRLIVVAILAQLLVAASAIGFLPRHDDGGDNAPSSSAGRALTGNQALLTGVVTDEDSGKPLAGVVIAIDHAAGPTTVRTGVDGRYSAVVDSSRPVGFTIDAPGHKGAVAFGKLCPKKRRDVAISLPSASSPAAPPAPLVLQDDCG